MATRREESETQYKKALKLGLRYNQDRVSRGLSPYPQVLDEIIQGSAYGAQEDLGIVNIPTDLIVGTRSAGRKSALAGNFMPLLPLGTEFAAKWVALCEANLSDEGIRDPISCYEYMGRFYVEEGNKRVSVLKSFGASTIPARVRRIIPAYSDDPAILAYYEFMAFYRLSRLFDIQFSQADRYAAFQATLGFDPSHVWTEEERRHFQSRYFRFRECYNRKIRKTPIPVNAPDALLVWLKIYTLSDLWIMSEAEIEAKLDQLWPDILQQSGTVPIEVSTSVPVREKSIAERVFGSTPDHLNIVFLYSSDPATSGWTGAHDLGRQYLEQQLGSKVTVSCCVCDPASAQEEMEKAIQGGAELIIATASAFIGASRKTAALHPDIRILNCAISMPYSGIRTYEGRLYEAKFIAGAVAGAMTRDKAIGYVANYPIYGVPASINAFALGARMTNPDVRIRLSWSCLPDPYAVFEKEHIHIISTREMAVQQADFGPHHRGTYRVRDDGTPEPLAIPCWNWGKLYESIVRHILNGGWNLHAGKPINYWWGMNTGAIDIELADSIPDGIRQLANILKKGLTNGSINPFNCRMTDQNGTIRNDGSEWPDTDRILHMDWLLDSIDGTIPSYDEILPMSRETVRLLGIHRESIPPTKEGVIL